MKDKTKILIVDDEPKNLRILKIHFEDAYELRDASSGEQALEILQSFIPAVVLLDIMMPGIDGYEVTRRIRANPRLAATKVILVSGKAMIDDKLDGYSSGANDYITKPFNGDELKAKLDTFIKMYDMEMQLRQQNASLEGQVELRSQQIIKSERMAFIGTHTSDIVHNLKNPLTILKMHLYKLESQIPDNESVKKMNAAVERILQIIKDVLSTNVEVREETQTIDINKLIKEELDFMQLGMTSNSQIKKEVCLAATRPVQISLGHLHQIIGNIIKNAVEALLGTDNGQIRITTEDQGESVLLTIQDNGQGIAPENIQRVFDPLFTTKTGDNNGPKGNGLGLPYCKKTIQSYGGSIDIQSKLGEGTKVSIRFPAFLSQINQTAS